MSATPAVLAKGPAGAELNRITERIIGCAIEVHRPLGPGLLEATYEAALAIEFEACDLGFLSNRCFLPFIKEKRLGNTGRTSLSRMQ